MRLAAAFGLAWLLASPSAALDLAGTWYVLVHYKDSAAPNPEAERWEDRIWVLERDAQRLRWADYPIVLFSDDTGRFERSSRQYARVLDFWEPSGAQLAEIRAGLEINPRGSESKSLRGSDTDGWRSGGASGPASANVLTYTETWSIDDPDGLPVFAVDESLGGARAETLEGRTEYRTTAIDPDGQSLRGSFNRDGTRVGTFRLLRSAAVREVTGGKTQQEIRSRISQQTGGDALTMELMRELLAESFEEYGIDSREVDLDAIIEAYQRMTAEGLPPGEITRRMEKEVIPKALAAQYAFARPGAVHDDSARYRMPFDPSTPRQLSQGVGGVGLAGGAGLQTGLGPSTHQGRHKYSFDFAMPVGTPVVAAREGTVARVVDGFTEGGPAKSLAGKANVVMVQHADGTVAVYVHLSPGILVKKGQTVAAGEKLGLSGNTGYTTGPHLHFSVWRFDQGYQPESVAILFDDGGQGFVPLAPNYYGGGGGGRAQPAER